MINRKEQQGAYEKEPTDYIITIVSVYAWKSSPVLLYEVLTIFNPILSNSIIVIELLYQCSVLVFLVTIDDIDSSLPYILQGRNLGCVVPIICHMEIDMAQFCLN